MFLAFVNFSRFVRFAMNLFVLYFEKHRYFYRDSLVINDFVCPNSEIAQHAERNFKEKKYFYFQ